MEPFLSYKIFANVVSVAVLIEFLQLQLAFIVELCRACDQALTSGDVGKHPGEQVLDELERADRLAELQTLLGIFERVLIGAHCAPRRLPADEIPRLPQHPRGVAK